MDLQSVLRKVANFCGEKVGYAAAEPNLEVYPFTFVRRERLKKARTSAPKIAICIRLVEKLASHVYCACMVNYVRLNFFREI